MCLPFRQHSACHDLDAERETWTVIDGRKTVRTGCGKSELQKAQEFLAASHTSDLTMGAPRSVLKAAPTHEPEPVPARKHHRNRRQGLLSSDAGGIALDKRLCGELK
jgi:hypothetical protein